VRAALTALLVPALLLASAGAAAAAGDPAPATVECGEAITRDTRLVESLSCEGEPGLRVDTPGVVLDLGGYTVAGDAGIGISVTAPGVVVRHGTVTGWPTAVFSGNSSYESEYAGGFDLPDLPWDPDRPAPDAVLDDLTITRNGVSAYDPALEVAGGRTTLRGSRLIGNEIGARAEYGGHLVLQRSEVSANSLGLQSLEGGPITVGTSLLRRNGTAAACSEGFLQIDLSAVSDNGLGVESFVCGGSTISRSAFTRNREHVWTEGFPDEQPTVGCTAFLGGGRAPDLPPGPCAAPPEF
jgi:hypothetical protein